MSSLYVSVAIFCWGIWSVLNKLAVTKVGTYYTQMSSYAVSIMLIPVFIYLGAQSDGGKRENVGFLFALAAAAFSSAASFCYLLAVKEKDVSAVLSATACYPAVGYALSVIFLDEKISSNKIFGFIIMILGAIMVNNR